MKRLVSRMDHRLSRSLPVLHPSPYVPQFSYRALAPRWPEQRRHHPRHYYIGGVRTTLLGAHSYPNTHRYPQRLIVVGGGTSYQKITRYSSSAEFSHTGVFSSSSTEDLYHARTPRRKAVSCEDVSRRSLSAWDCRLSESGVSLSDSRTDLASCSGLGDGDVDGASQCSFGSSSAFHEITLDSEQDGRLDSDCVSVAGSLCVSETTVDGDSECGEGVQTETSVVSDKGRGLCELNTSDCGTSFGGGGRQVYHSTPIKGDPPILSAPEEIFNQAPKDYTRFSLSSQTPVPNPPSFSHTTQDPVPLSHVHPPHSSQPGSLQEDDNHPETRLAGSIPASADTVRQRQALQQKRQPPQPPGKRFPSLQAAYELAERTAGDSVQSWLTTGHTQSRAAVTHPPSLISERGSFSHQQQHQQPLQPHRGVSLPSSEPARAVQTGIGGGSSVRVLEQGPILQITESDCRDNKGLRRAARLQDERCHGQSGASGPTPTPEGGAGSPPSSCPGLHPAPESAAPVLGNGSDSRSRCSDSGGNDAVEFGKGREENAPTVSPVFTETISAEADTPTLSDAITDIKPRPAFNSRHENINPDNPRSTDDGAGNSRSTDDDVSQPPRLTGEVTGHRVDLASRDCEDDTAGLPGSALTAGFNPAGSARVTYNLTLEGKGENTSAGYRETCSDDKPSYRASLFSEHSDRTRREDLLTRKRKGEEEERGKEEEEEGKKEEECNMKGEFTTAGAGTLSAPTSSQGDNSCGKTAPGPAFTSHPHATPNYSPTLPSTHTPLALSRAPALPGGDDQQVGLGARQQQQQQPQQQWRGVNIPITRPSASVSTPEEAEVFLNQRQPSTQTDEGPEAKRIDVDRCERFASPATNGEVSRRHTHRSTTTTTITTTTTTTVEEEETVVTTRRRLRHSSASPTAQRVESCALFTAGSASADAASVSTKQSCHSTHDANRTVSREEDKETAEDTNGARVQAQQRSSRLATLEVKREEETERGEENGACLSPHTSAVVSLKSVTPVDVSGHAHLSSSPSQQQQRPPGDRDGVAGAMMAGTGSERIGSSLDLLDSLQQQLSLLSSEDASFPANTVYLQGCERRETWYRDHAEASLPGVHDTADKDGCVEGRGRVSITLSRHREVRVAGATVATLPVRTADHLSSHGSPGSEFQRETSSPVHASVSPTHEWGEAFSGDEGEGEDRSFPPLRSQLTLWRPPSSSSELDDSDSVYTSISTTDSDHHAESDFLSSDGYGAEEYDNVDSFNAFVSGLQGQYTSDRASHPHHHRLDTMCGRLRSSIQETILEADDESETADEMDTTASSTLSSFRSSFHFSLPQSSPNFQAVSPVPEIRLWSTDQQVTTLGMAVSSTGGSKADTLVNSDVQVTTLDMAVSSTGASKADTQVNTDQQVTSLGVAAFSTGEDKTDELLGTDHKLTSLAMSASSSSASRTDTRLSTGRQVTSLAMSASPSRESKTATLPSVHLLQDLSDRLSSFEEASFELHTLQESYDEDDLDASLSRHSACSSPDVSNVSECGLYSTSATAEVRKEMKVDDPTGTVYTKAERRSSTPLKTSRKPQWIRENVLLFQKLLNELETESRPAEQTVLEEMCSMESGRGGNSTEQPAEQQREVYGDLYRSFTQENLEKRQSHVCPFVEDHLPVLRFKRFLRKKHNSKVKGRKTFRVRHLLDSVSECVKENGTGSVSESDLPSLTQTERFELARVGEGPFHQHSVRLRSSTKVPDRPLSEVLSDDTDVKRSLSDSAYSTLSDVTSRHVSDLDSSLTRSAYSSHGDVTSVVTDLSLDSDKMTSLGDVFDQLNFCEGEIDQALLDRLHVGHYKADTL